MNHLSLRPVTFDLCRVQRESYYKSLPRLSWKTNHPLTNKYIVTPLADVCCSIWQPTLNIGLSFYCPWPQTSYIMKSHLFSPLCTEALKEIEKKVQEIAKRVKLVAPDRVKVYVPTNPQAIMMGSGLPNFQPTLFVGPEWLLRPSDLPSFLRLNSSDSIEDECIIEFECWLDEYFMNQCYKFGSRYEWDMRRLKLKVWLELFHHSDRYQKVLEYLIGHELGHISYHHSLKSSLVDLGWQTFSLALGGPLLLLTHRVRNVYSYVTEKQADLFSIQNIGQVETAIQYWTAYEKSYKQMLIKYPEITLATKKRKEGYNYPTISERIKYLQELPSQ